MNRKEIISEINSVAAQNKELYSKCILLKKENEDKTKEIERLNNIVQELEARLEVVLEKNEQILCADITENETVEDAASSEQNIVAELEENKSEDVAVNMASEYIGKMVVLCTRVCNNLFADENENAKDLISLALGRTEVSKSDAMIAVSETKDLDELKTKLDKILSVLDEYFLLLMHQ